MFGALQGVPKGTACGELFCSTNDGYPPTHGGDSPTNVGYPNANGSLPPTAGGRPTTAVTDPTAATAGGFTPQLRAGISTGTETSGQGDADAATQQRRPAGQAVMIPRTSPPHDRSPSTHPQGAVEGEGPQRRPQERLDRRFEEVAKAVGGGYTTGQGRHTDATFPSGAAIMIPYCQPMNGLFREEGTPLFFLLRTTPRDHRPPATNRQPPPTTSRHQRPTANCCQPPTTHPQQPQIANHQPHATATSPHQPPTANGTNHGGTYELHTVFLQNCRFQTFPPPLRTALGPLLVAFGVV